MTDYKEKLIALLEGLECQHIEEAVEEPPIILRRIGEEIAESMKQYKRFRINILHKGC